MNPFDVIKDITHEKRGIISEENESEYNPWMVNKGLSNFVDTIEHANRMNMQHHLPKKLQNDYLINIIRKKKRFSKWFKADKNDDLEIVMRYYNCNRQKAKSIILILSSDQLEEIKEKLSE